MTTNRCPEHDTPTKDATLCHKCLWDVERDLGDIPALADELDTTISRQTASGQRDGGRSAEVPMPYNVRASQVATDLHATLVGWVRDMHDPREHWPADTATSMARWMLSRIERIRQHPAGDQLRDEISYAVREARRAVDRPADRIFAGPCLAPVDDGKCQTDLYAKPGSPTVKCRECQTEHDVIERQVWLLAQVEDRLETAAHIAQAMPSFGAELKYDRIRKWVERGRLTAHSVDQNGRALYRIGDVIELLAAEQDKEVRRAG
jgi:hypothetical protein